MPALNAPLPPAGMRPPGSRHPCRRRAVARESKWSRRHSEPGLCQPELESLLVDRGAPLRSAALLDESEASVLVEMPRRAEALEGPEVHPLVAAAATEVDRGGDETLAHPAAAQGIGHDEPAEMGSLHFRMEPVDRDGPFHAPVQGCDPEAVTRAVISPEKLRKLGGHLRLEEQPESPVRVVVGAMQLGHAADGAWDIAPGKLDAWHAKSPESSDSARPAVQRSRPAAGVRATRALGPLGRGGRQLVSGGGP